MRQTLVILFGCLISEMFAVFGEFTTSWVLEPENATYCFPSIPGNEAVDSCASDQLISLSSKPTFLLCNIGSVSCFVMPDPGNVLLYWMVGCKPSSTEGTRINLPRDDEQTFLWPVVLLCYFSMLGSWEAPAAPLATFSPPEASKHLQTTRTLQQHMATSIDLHPPHTHTAAALKASRDSVRWCTPSTHRWVLATCGNQHWPETPGKFLCHLQPAISHGRYTPFVEVSFNLGRAPSPSL